MLRMLLILIFIDWNKYLKKKRTEKRHCEIASNKHKFVSYKPTVANSQTTIQLNNHSAKQTIKQTNKHTDQENLK